MQTREEKFSERKRKISEGFRNVVGSLRYSYCVERISFIRKKSSYLIRQKSLLRYWLDWHLRYMSTENMFLVSQISTSEKVLIYGISKFYLKRGFELKR